MGQAFCTLLVLTAQAGDSEAGFVTFHTARALRKPGTVGRPRSGATIRVYDNEGRELPPGEVGEIYTWLHGMPDFTYHGLPERRREIERDGLVSLGDIGYLDEDGYLFLGDRKRDMVISGGVNIYPAEIEAALFALVLAGQTRDVLLAEQIGAVALGAVIGVRELVRHCRFLRVH